MSKKPAKPTKSRSSISDVIEPSEPALSQYIAGQIQWVQTVLKETENYEKLKQRFEFLQDRMPNQEPRIEKNIEWLICNDTLLQETMPYLEHIEYAFRKHHVNSLSQFGAESSYEDQVKLDRWIRTSLASIKNMLIPTEDKGIEITFALEGLQQSLEAFSPKGRSRAGSKLNSDESKSG